MDASSVLLENQDWLRTIVYSRLGDQLATEDVLQEISLAALTSTRKGQCLREGRGWLYQVAVRQVMLFRRKEARHRRRVERAAVRADSAFQANPLEALCDLEAAREIRASLEQIRPTDKQILVLKYSHDLTCRQIAELLGVRESTVQSRLLRARRRLRSALTNSNSVT